MSVTTLGFDTGFASFGWAVAEIHDRAIHPVALGVIRTKRDSKLPKLADNHRRLGAISNELLTITTRWRPDVICVESIALVRGGQVSQGYAFGLLEMLVEVCDVALIQASAQKIKAATAGKGSTKQEVQAHLDTMFAGRVSELLKNARVPRTQQEHPVDALGSIVASLDADTMRALRSADAKAFRAKRGES